jgi:hypothetical protein
MKTQNDRTSHHKGSTSQPVRGGSDSTRSGAGTHKDGKQAIPAKPPTAGDTPKRGKDVRADSHAIDAPTGPKDAKDANARRNSTRKPA